ncbi:unnamed protein product [Prorocentrum cordatum]|uniref:Reverse transcriptase Ty1/copia-type domain-containing protein n=1 Tax=Prorocentrum cordatum TaxID=2364126 RepID=A0ABN9SMZ7_9DINO|nr:unnamed protein product [Polarella glacialis]
MGAVENTNKEVKNLPGATVLHLGGEAKVELHTGHLLVPWLARHCGWCICMCRVRADGRAEGKRWNRKMLDKALRTPRLPRLGAKTPAYLDKYGLAPECPGCAGRRGRRHPDLKSKLPQGSRRPLEPPPTLRWQLLSRMRPLPLHQGWHRQPAAPSWRRRWRLGVSRRTARGGGLSFQEKVELFERGGADVSGPASSRRRAIGVLRVCGQPPHAGARGIATPAAYVATPDIDAQDVEDHKTGEVLDPELARAGRARERQNTMDRRLFERAPTKNARGKEVRSIWLDEKEFNMRDRLDTHTATPPLKFIKLIVSRAASIRRHDSNDWTRVLGLYDIAAAFWHADLPLDEPITVIPPRGEEDSGMAWQMLKAMHGTRRAPQLFLEFMAKVFDQRGYQALKTSRQIFYAKQHDSLASLWGDDIIAEAESKGIEHLGAMISLLFNIKVLPRVGPGCTLMGRSFKHCKCYLLGLGCEWNEDPKRAMMLLESTGKLKAKPQGGPCSKHIGRGDPDELDGEAQTKHRSDTGRALYASPGRFDIQYSAKELGCPFLALFFKHVPEAGGSWIPVDSNWAEEPDCYSTHAGCEIVGSHLIESWVVADQARALSSAEAEFCGTVVGAARGIMTQSLFKNIADMRGAATARSVTVGSAASVAIGNSSRSGAGKTHHIAARWLWVQDAAQENQITLKKIPGETNVADLGAKALEPKRRQELAKRPPPAKPTCRRFSAAPADLAATPETQGAR